MPFGNEKTKMLWLPGDEIILFINFDMIHERDRHDRHVTDRHTHTHTHTQA